MSTHCVTDSVNICTRKQKICVSSFIANTLLRWSGTEPEIYLRGAPILSCTVKGISYCGLR